MSCLMSAWGRHESELRRWLRGRLGNSHDAEDMLQDLFLKAMRQDRKFCEIDNARAWLYEVARNAVADCLRLKKNRWNCLTTWRPSMRKRLPWNGSPPVCRAHSPNCPRETAMPSPAAISKA